MDEKEKEIRTIINKQSCDKKNEKIQHTKIKRKSSQSKNTSANDSRDIVLKPSTINVQETEGRQIKQMYINNVINANISNIGIEFDDDDDDAENDDEKEKEIRTIINKQSCDKKNEKIQHTKIKRKSSQSKNTSSNDSRDIVLKPSTINVQETEGRQIKQMY